MLPIAEMPAPDSTAWDLIERAAAGADDARAEFAERYQALVRTWLDARWRTTPLRDAVHDATQEVFLACLKPDGALRNASPDWPQGFRAYLRGVTRNIASKFERSASLDRARHHPDPIELERQPLPQTSIVRRLDRNTARSLLREAADLQARSAPAISEQAVLRVELLRLRFHEGLPIREIAARWKRDPAWVHHQYATAREEFKRALLDLLTRRSAGSVEQAEAECLSLMRLFD